jgi:hypothetical protein
MFSVRKVPYYTMQRSVFSRKVWKEHQGSSGAVPINTPQSISYERLAPGVPVPPPPSKEQLKTLLAQQTQPKPLMEIDNKQFSLGAVSKETGGGGQLSRIVDAENREKLPEFDLQDIPDAMDNFGWPMSAKVARRWFSSPAHVWDNDLDSIQPIDDGIVTLDWALKYGKVKDRLDELLKTLYSKNAHAVLKKKITQHVEAAFRETKSTSPNLSFDTSIYISDLGKFHTSLHFQTKEVTIMDTIEGTQFTDLSGALGNFVMYAAIGKVEVSSSKYFNYATKPYQYCIDSKAKVTHAYLYLKDNYSFNDKDPSKSQYLGHWNKKDMVMSYYLSINDIIGQFYPKLRRQNKNDNDVIVEQKEKWGYFPDAKEVDKPIDTRGRLLRKYVEKDIYWPVYNRNYNEWREKHKRGGDFMIYSKPKLYKLKTPIEINLDTICRPYDSTSSGQ